MKNYFITFFLPDLFQQKITKDEFEVIQIFSSVNVEKIFIIKDFFQNYPSALSNQQKTKMKRYFIELVKVLEQDHLIESNYKIISNGNFYHTRELTTTNISEGFAIYEKFSV